VAARLPSPDWPQQAVRIVAVDAHTREPVVFDRHSGVALVDAVTASCAGTGSPHSIGDNRYIDGGFRRNENADLASGYGRVLVLSPFSGRSLVPPEWGSHLSAQVEELRGSGSRVETIVPDSNCRGVMGFGATVMDPLARPPSARAGYDQGRAITEQLTKFWR
jgi:NTE family protein